VRRDLRAAWPGLILLVLGTGVGVFWSLRYGASTGIDYHILHRALAQAPGNFWDFTRQLVAVFGYLEYRLPRLLYVPWFGLIAVLAYAAFSVGSRRQRKLLVAAAAGVVLAPIALWALLGRAIGNGMSGRIFLPVVVVFPMLCGEAVYRHRERLSKSVRSGVMVFLGGAGIVQFGAWYLNGRRSAVGIHGPLLYPLHAQWSPPLGWLPWLACAAIGALLLASLSVERRPRVSVLTRSAWIRRPARLRSRSRQPAAPA
jgi:hypothetical protein